MESFYLAYCKHVRSIDTFETINYRSSAQFDFILAVVMRHFFALSIVKNKSL